MPKLPALDPSGVEPRVGTPFPEPFNSKMAPREKRPLAAPLGLQKLGVNLTTLLPGKMSSIRHFHTREDEFIYILEGEVVLVTDAGEQSLGAGACVGFPAGVEDAHHFVNRSKAPARYLEVANRDAEDRAHFPHDDLSIERAADGRPRFVTGKKA